VSDYPLFTQVGKKLIRIISREKALKALLCRHPDLSADDEEFLTNKLQVRQEWLHEAKVSGLGR